VGRQVPLVSFPVVQLDDWSSAVREKLSHGDQSFTALFKSDQIYWRMAASRLDYTCMFNPFKPSAVKGYT